MSAHAVPVLTPETAPQTDESSRGLASGKSASSSFTRVMAVALDERGTLGPDTSGGGISVFKYAVLSASAVPQAWLSRALDAMG